jgi:methionyl-tRNA synthetase
MKYIVTITPPTPNGDLHLGHLSGPFLAADVCARVLKQKGHDVLLVSYSDDYQSYMLRKAHQVQKNAFTLAINNCKEIKLSLDAVDIKYDHFMQAYESEAFASNVEYYFKLIKNAEQITKNDTKVFLCETCNVYGYEGLGRCKCNWCGASSDASQCEECGRAPDVDKIDSMECMLCNHEMKPIVVNRWVWSLGKNYPKLRAHYQYAPMRMHLREFLSEQLQNESTLWPITRPSDAGLNLNRDELIQQPIHTWFMGLAGYRATLEEHLETNPQKGKLEDWWNTSTNLIHFLGFDCSFSHALGYAALQVLDPTAPKPGVCITNEFLKLDGSDFSTSRGHAVWIREIVAQYPIDAVRLFTALNAPENNTENFDRNSFSSWYQSTYLKIVEFYKKDMTGNHELLNVDDLSKNKYIKEFNEVSSLEGFSISKIAKLIIEYAEKIISIQDSVMRKSQWQYFFYVASSICPNFVNAEHSK